MGNQLNDESNVQTSKNLMSFWDQDDDALSDDDPRFKSNELGGSIVSEQRDKKSGK